MHQYCAICEKSYVGTITVCREEQSEKAASAITSSEASNVRSVREESPKMVRYNNAA